jgi:threonine synthase
MAYRQGLPVEHFVAACNVNDVFTRYIHSGEYIPTDAFATLSNAMDVGNPSNFVRVVEMFEKSHTTLTQKISSQSVNDQDTRRALVACFQENKYTLDPHGAVAFLALKDYLKNHPGQEGLFLETAHPVKFPEAVEESTGQIIDIPESVKTLQANPKSSIQIEATYGALLEKLG